MHFRSSKQSEIHFIYLARRSYKFLMEYFFAIFYKCMRAFYSHGYVLISKMGFMNADSLDVNQCRIFLKTLY